MTGEINLAKRTIAKVRQRERLKRLVNRSVFAFGIFFSGVLIILAGFSLAVNRKNQALDNQIKTTQRKIESLSKVEGQQVYLTSKLNTFGELFKSHQMHQSIAETIFDLIPSGTSLKGFQVNDSGKIVLSGSAPGWQIFSQLLTNLKQPNAGQVKIKTVGVSQVNFSSEGLISFDLELSLSL